MKRLLKLTLTSLLGISLLATGAKAQPPGMGGAAPGPKFGGDLTKVFGDNPRFSATVEFKAAAGPNGSEMTIPGSMAYLDGKSRFEMDITEMKGGGLPAGAADQVKAMHMDKMVVISRPDKKVSYMVYTGLKGYVETPVKDESDSKTAADYKMDVTKIGEETVDGHDCVQNKVVVTDNKGEAHEMTVWNAKDLKKFPLKIKSTEKQGAFEMAFKNIKLEKPDDGQFEPPADCTKYTDMMKLIMSAMPH